MKQFFQKLWAKLFGERPLKSPEPQPNAEVIQRIENAERNPEAYQKVGGGPKMPETISQDGIDLIVHFEGIYLKAYLDSVNCPTIGIGRIKGVTHEDVKRGRTCTKEEAYAWFREDLEEEAAQYIRAWTKVPLSQCQWDSLCSFVFNRGCGRFRSGDKSIGLEGVLPFLNRGDYQGAADQLLKFNWAGKDHRYLLGLDRRRYAEREMFIGGDWRKFDSVAQFKVWKKGNA